MSVQTNQKSSPLLTTSFTVGLNRIVYHQLASAHATPDGNECIEAAALTCSNWAVYEPLASHSGGYASTTPLETRLLSFGSSA